MAFAFEKLIVYQKSVDFANRITEQTGQFRRVSTSLQTSSIGR